MSTHPTRRYFLRDCAYGVGGIALASLVAAERKASGNGPASGAIDLLGAKKPHFAPRAKRVIFLFMAGGPSQLDLFESKPTLERFAGQPVPASVLQGMDLPFIESDAALMPSPFRYARYGQSGAELSELVPHLAEVADDIAIVRNVRTDAFNHAPAQILLNTGSMIMGRPSMGAWVLYGLGSESRNLPSYVVLDSATGNSGGAACWGNGFLPSYYQGVPFRSKGDPVLFVSSPEGHTDEMQRATIDTVNKLNAHRLADIGDPEIRTRIASYEMAGRMQSSAPDLMDLGQETQETLDLYGVDPSKPSFAKNCLLARRLIERDVRFVTLMHQEWDHHSEVNKNMKQQCKITDQACGALITDLKRRGLLEDTLVVWGGEFGRTPMVENNPAVGRSQGRDHHPHAFTIWMAGGGVKAGVTLGATDDLGYFPADGKGVHLHDIHATMLHLLGLDHLKLTFPYQGRDFRLTDVSGNIVQEILA
jgi:uncharacterized protein (DUF1501 family)